MRARSGDHSHKISGSNGSRNRVEGRYFVKLWYNGIYLFGTRTQILVHESVDDPGTVLRVESRDPYQLKYSPSSPPPLSAHTTVQPNSSPPLSPLTAQPNSSPPLSLFYLFPWHSPSRTEIPCASLFPQPPNLLSPDGASGRWTADGEAGARTGRRTAAGGQRAVEAGGRCVRRRMATGGRRGRRR